MSIIGSGHALLLASEAAAAVPTEISRSLRFNSGDSAYLNRTPSTAGNRKTWTWAGWVKRSAFSSTQRIFCAGSGSSYTEILFISDKLKINTFNFGSDVGQVQTQAVFRDPSAWYHAVISFNAAGTSKIYVNGVEQSLTTITAISNIDHQINNTVTHRLGSYFSGADYLNGYLADVHLVDGQALDSTSFGEFDATTGVWNPIEVTGLSYGTNGFHLTFSDNSGTSSTTLGKDAAGSNNWTPNNFSVASGSGNDSLVDVPRNGDETDTGVGGEVRGNYCTLNPLAKGPNTTLSNGNLEQTTTSSGGCVLGTFGMSSGKWYWEALNGTSGNNGGYGIALSDIDLSGYPGQQANAWSYLYTGDKYNNGSGASYGSTFTAGDIIGVAFDADNGTLTFYKNGVSQGTAFTGLTSGPYLPLMGAAPSYSAANFGQRPFAYTAPSGFKALCTTNLTDPTITDPSDYMDVKLYTGNGSTQTISGLGFSPDLVWVKSRNQAYNHYLWDVIRGAGETLFSNTTDAETTQTDTLTSFDSTGFSLDNRTGVNSLNNTFVAWTWDAGTFTSTNTDGSINSEVRANASAGFSVVKFSGYTYYTDYTIGHGLNVQPSLIICRDSNKTSQWGVYHSGLTAGHNLYLNDTSAAASRTSVQLFVGSPTSSVFTYRTNNGGSGHEGIAYCFAPVAGYSAFGSYTGNGSTDGPFVYTGFRPRWVLFKRTNAAYGWLILDTERDTVNVMDKWLEPNVSSAESTIATTADFLSNGFKLRNGTWNVTNASGGTYIYAAFAESPQKYARAR